MCGGVESRGNPKKRKKASSQREKKTAETVLAGNSRWLNWSAGCANWKKRQGDVFLGGANGGGLVNAGVGGSPQKKKKAFVVGGGKKHRGNVGKKNSKGRPPRDSPGESRLGRVG